MTKDFYLRMVLVGVLMLAGAFGLFYIERAAGSGDDYARTVAVNVFIVAQTFYLFSCRSLTKPVFEIGIASNKFALGGAVLIILVQLAFTYVPFMNLIFHTEPLQPSAWFPIIGVGIHTCSSSWKRESGGGWMDIFPSGSPRPDLRDRQKGRFESEAPLPCAASLCRIRSSTSDPAERYADPRRSAIR